MNSLKAFGVDKNKGRHYEEGIYSLALIYNIINNEISSYLQPFNLTPGKLNILMTIKHQGKDHGISQVEVSKHLIVTPSNMTKLIDKLEKEKLATRSALAGDRRVNIIRITARGSQLLNEVWPDYTAKLKTLYAVLDNEKQKMLSMLLLDWFERLRK